MTNVIYNDAGVHLKPKYFPNLRTFIFGTTCNDIYNPYPRFYESSHGQLVRKLLSIPTLRRLHIRTIENFTHPGFWQAVGQGLAQRMEPIYIDVGCGIRGDYKDYDGEYAEKYEEELRRDIGILKPDQVFNYSSSWNVFKIDGGEEEVEEEEEEEEENEEEEEDQELNENDEINVEHEENI